MNTKKENRTLLFEYLSSIELDLRQFIHENALVLPENFMNKALERFKQENGNSTPHDSELLFYLDFKDYIEIIDIFSNDLKINNKKYKQFSINIKDLVPIRNRVMHNRPPKTDDISLVSMFVSCFNENNKIIPLPNLREAMDNIAKNPNFIFDNIGKNKKIYVSKDVLHNLPYVDYEDTGFVGRESDKKNLLSKINGPYPVISIIGDGGIGKTALVLNLLYELLEMNELSHERVIWVSLKTKSLQDGEFKDIKNHFYDFEGLIQSGTLYKFDGTNNIKSLLNYMTKYSTILVIDNLETIDFNNIKSIFDNLPKDCKVLITSRIGLGEYETRIKLDKLNDEDSLQYFRKLIKAYDVKPLSRLSNERALEFIKQLHHSPLAMKWYVINVGKGGPLSIHQDQATLVEYCLSNVFEKLTFSAKLILKIMILLNDECTPAEIVYISNMQYEKTIEGIKELFRSNFVDQNEFGKYYIPEFTLGYLRTKLDFQDEESEELVSRINVLHGKMENLISDKRLKDKARPLSFFPSNNEEKIATIYMMQFIDASKKDDLATMSSALEEAKRCAANFTDIYKVAAYLYGKKKDRIRAIDHYETALKLVKTEEDRAYIQYFYSGYLASVHSDYDKAMALIDEALNHDSKNIYFIMNKAKILKYTKRFENAKDVYETILSTWELSDEVSKWVKTTIHNDLIDIDIRILDMKSHNNLVSLDDYIRIIEVFKGISQEYYEFPIYKLMYKFARELLLNVFKVGTLNLLEEFISNFFPYMFYVRDAVKSFDEFTQKLKLTLNNDNFTVSKDPFVFKVYDYGYICSVNVDKGFGFITVRNQIYVYFNIRNFIGSFNKNIKGRFVRFKPVFDNGKIYAIEVELHNSTYLTHDSNRELEELS